MPQLFQCKLSGRFRDGTIAIICNCLDQTPGGGVSMDA